MIVDMNMGWFPEHLFRDKSLLNEVVRSIPRGYGEIAEIKSIPGMNKVQLVLSKPEGYENINVTESFNNPEVRLEVMDEAGVDKAFMQISVFQGWLDLEMSKKFNDWLAEDVGKYPDRLLGLAMVPPWGDDDCLDELERCVKKLGYRGILCAAHYGNLYLDKKEFRPYFKKINELGVPVIVHHTPLPVDYMSLYEYTNIRRGLGRIFDQLTCLARILESDLLDECPNLKLIFTMMAGGYYAFKHMLIPKKSVTNEEMERSNFGQVQKIPGYLKNNIYFDLTHAEPWGKAQLECAVKELGADHILFGGGFPVKREWVINGIKFVNNLDISEQEKSLILGQNAVKLFKLNE